ncbi:cell wall biogenesis protein ecm15 [Alternaria burnsii]|uniref:Cell wall biogenesis protein ecm15 n=1 Tax=Alternaria burnsii TaxID=1187904 RepID=A0A8H7BJ28_9PLEO|nr:cell wall biogenesis protein ecm15 [Alternaria burnsii]KAF7680411.1 cell wall biogenesis protein ecm15 [Alternaria burnsii]
MSASNDVANLATPPSCIADFCLIPLGTPTASVSKEVAEVQRVLKRSGLTYSMHSAGTTVGMTLHIPLYVVDALASEPTPFSAEGSWDDVMRVIGQCHAMLHQNGIVRIQSDIRVGSRTDKKQGFKDKVEAVEKLLKEDQGAAL